MKAALFLLFGLVSVVCSGAQNGGSAVGHSGSGQPSIFWRNGEWQTYQAGEWSPYFQQAHRLKVREHAKFSSAVVTPRSSDENKSASRSRIGEPNTDVGQPNTPIGRPNIAVGTPNTAIGQPNTSIGKPNTNIGRPITAIGQPNTSIGRPTTGLGGSISPNEKDGQKPKIPGKAQGDRPRDVRSE